MNALPLSATQYGPRSVLSVVAARFKGPCR